MTVSEIFKSISLLRLFSFFCPRRPKSVRRADKFIRPRLELLEEKVLLSNFYWHPEMMAPNLFASTAANWEDDNQNVQVNQPSFDDKLIFNANSGRTACSMQTQTGNMRPSESRSDMLSKLGRPEIHGR